VATQFAQLAINNGEKSIELALTVKHIPIMQRMSFLNTGNYAD